MNFKQFLIEQNGNVGIFWINSKDEIFADGLTLKDAEPYGNKMTYPESHYNIWRRKMRHQHPEFKYKEYEEVPRGRIVYSIPNKQYIVYLPTAYLQNKRVHQKVIQQFNLSGEKIRIAADSHYDPPQISLGSEEDWDF